MNRHEKRALKRLQKKQVEKAISRGGWGVWKNRDDLVGHPEAPPGMTHAYTNELYSVQRFDYEDVIKLMIRRHDGSAVHDWKQLQRIKNEICGAAKTAIEVYPPQRELTDEANMYWLWVLPDGVSLPFKLR